MDHPSTKQLPDKSDVKLSFHKPSQDATNRKYRRHTPVGGSDSSASEGSPLRRIRSPDYSEDRRKKDGERELERDSTHTQPSRGSDSQRHSDRQSYGTSHDYARNSDSSRHSRHADETDRGYQRPSRSDRESRSDTRSDYTRHEKNSDRYRDTSRTGDKYSRDKFDSVGHGAKDKDHRFDDREFDKAASKSRQKDSSRDDTRIGERDRHRDREPQGERRDRHRSPTDYKNDRGSYREEPRGHAKDSTLGRDRGSIRLKETLWSDSKEIDAQREKRKYDDRESDRRKDKSTREAEAEIKKDTKTSSCKERDRKDERGLDKSINASEDQSSSKKLKHGFTESGTLSSKSIAHDADEKALGSKHVKEPAEKVTSEPASATSSQFETAKDLDAAKVAAMKAAELVNRNLVGGSYMSTDQKKKLLWGNKKSTTTEESGNRWDLHLFSDRERQEKFKKLMGVKGDTIPVPKPDKKDGNLRAEQEQLEMDLEKQYTAGLRRRDGRTVGLGL
ncbi:protein starmaker isoform X3 [Iris pallida]|uniref:Protein starmaker isoform X3 n=1 Tax=Iris pallida TaxID=29817 RepID=A0AAX6DFX3_IRIPA|nr:protein starmaker isoform X3 [Iris pallida]